MNKLFQQLLQQARSRIVPTATRAVQGFADGLVPPVLRGIATKANPSALTPQIIRSFGTVQDALVRPVTRFGQDTLLNPLVGAPRTSIPGGVARQLVTATAGRGTPFLQLPASYNNPRYILDPAQRFLREFGQFAAPSAGRTTASLRPSPSSDAFPFDDVLTRLRGQARYLQRQTQTGLTTSLGQVDEIYRNLQGIGPTALNPLATRTPTTLLGKAGKFINPLNPVNVPSYIGGGLISAFLPENANKGNVELAAFTPGGLPAKIAVTTLLGATPAGPADESELIRQSNALRQLGQNYTVNGIKYDYTTGKAINPPANVFIPARQAGGGSPPPPPAPNLPPPPNMTAPVTQAGQQPPFMPAAERDYQNNKSRVAQLTEQDQLLKKYNVADLTKAYNAAKGDERERLGMEIFALTNPGLAKKVKPGQTGYETIQATRQANTPFGSALSAIPSSSTTNYQSAFTAMPADKIVSQAFGGVSGEGVQSILNTTPDLSKAVAGLPVGEKPLVGMSIKDAFTSSVFNPSQDNLSALQLALLKEAFNKRLK